MCECNRPRERGTCKYCKSDIPSIAHLICDPEIINEIEKDRNYTWKLQEKHNYYFAIDIFGNNQTGCEELIRLEDIDNGVLKEKFLKAKNYLDQPNYHRENYRKGIPEFNYTIGKVNSADCINYVIKIENNKQNYVIDYNNFIKCCNEELYSIESKIKRLNP